MKLLHPQACEDFGHPIEHRQAVVCEGTVVVVCLRCGHAAYREGRWEAVP